MYANKILYDYITNKYGDVVNFANISGIALIDLNALLLKDNVSTEICIGLNLCRILNIDIEKMIYSNQIHINSPKPEYEEYEEYWDIPEKSNNSDYDKDNNAAKREIYNRCMRLSEIEKKKVLEYIDDILIEKE